MRKAIIGCSFAAGVYNPECTKKQIAIAINGSVIQKKEYKKTIIREGDKIEVVHAVGGGI